jgi:hypothetical protein
MNPDKFKGKAIPVRNYARQRPRDGQMYQSRCWVTRFADKARSHGNDLSIIATATNEQAIIEELLETVFSTVVRAEGL